MYKEEHRVKLLHSLAYTYLMSISVKFLLLLSCNYCVPIWLTSTCTSKMALYGELQTAQFYAVLQGTSVQCTRIITVFIEAYGCIVQMQATVYI